VKVFAVATLLALVSPSAFAQQHEIARSEVATGQDLVAWQTLEQRRLAGSAAIEAYKAYLLRYPESPFAVAAFGRLVDLRAPVDAWIEEPEMKVAITPIRRAWEQSQRTLTAATARRAVVMMDLGDAIADEDDGGRDTGR
jgi:hypothetical protein